MPLDPKKKYLIQDGSNAIFQWTEVLGKRKDMRGYDPRTEMPIARPSGDPTVSIELQGQTFQVNPKLSKIIIEMGDKLVELQGKIKALEAQAENFDAFKERLTTDNADLQEQLDAARENAPPPKSAFSMDIPEDASETTERKKPGPKPKDK